MPDATRATIDAMASFAPLSDEREAELVSEIGSRDGAAWDLVLHNMRFLISLCADRVNNGQDISDLLHVAYMEAHRAAHRYNNQGFRFAAYLSRCVSWKLYDEMNRANCSHYDIDKFDDDNRAISDTPEFGPSPGFSGSKQMVELAMDALSPLEREVVELRHGISPRRNVEMSFREIGEIVGMTGHGALLVARRAYKKAAKSPAIKEYRRLAR